MVDRPSTYRATPSGSGRSARGRAYGGEAPRGSVDPGLTGRGAHVEAGLDGRGERGALGFRGAGEEHRDRAGVQHLLGHAAKERLVKAAVPVRAHDDQVESV